MAVWLKPFLSITAAAKRVHTTPQQIANHIRFGRLPATKIGGRRYIRATDLDSLFPIQR